MLGLVALGMVGSPPYLAHTLLRWVEDEAVMGAGVGCIGGWWEPLLTWRTPYHDGLRVGRGKCQSLAIQTPDRLNMGDGTLCALAFVYINKSLCTISPAVP